MGQIYLLHEYDHSCGATVIRRVSNRSVPFTSDPSRPLTVCPIRGRPRLITFGATDVPCFVITVARMEEELRSFSRALQGLPTYSGRHETCRCQMQSHRSHPLAGIGRVGATRRATTARKPSGAGDRPNRTAAGH